MTYDGYVRKRSKYMPTVSYFYAVIQRAKFMMSTQNVNNFNGLAITKNMSTQKMSNLRVCSIDERK